MDTGNKSTFWIAIGLTAAFLMGGLAATTGIAVTRVAATAMFGGGESVHAGHHPASDAWAASDECVMVGEPIEGHGPGMRAPGMQREWDADADSRGMRPGMRGGDVFEGHDFESEGFEESCPMWGTF